MCCLTNGTLNIFIDVLCTHIYGFLLDICLQMKLLRYRICIYTYLGLYAASVVTNVKQHPKWLANLYSHQPRMLVLHSLANIWYIKILDFNKYVLLYYCLNLHFCNFWRVLLYIYCLFRYTVLTRLFKFLIHVFTCLLKTFSV